MKKIKLGHLGILKMGETLIKNDLTGHGTPVFSANSTGKPWGYTQNNKKFFKRGTLVISARGTIGQINLPNFSEFTCTQTTIAFEPNIMIGIPEYLYYAFKKINYKSITKGVGIPMLTISDLSEIEIPLPSLEEQKIIVQKLDKITELIALKEEAIRKTEALTKSVFLEMFIYGDLNDQEWPIVTIGSLASNKKGSMRTGPFGSDLLHSEFVDSGVYVLGIDNVVHNVFEWGKERYITQEKYKKLERYTVQSGDVLVSIMATIGRSAVVPSNIPIAINSKHLAAITLDQNKANSIFIAFCIHSNPEILDQIGRNERGAIMEGLNLGIIKSLKLKLPPILLQSKFADLYTKNISVIEHQKHSLHSLQSLYNSTSQAIFDPQ